MKQILESKLEIWLFGSNLENYRINETPCASWNRPIISLELSQIYIFEISLRFNWILILLGAYTEDEFGCNNGILIPISFVCDGNSDCSAAEDEEQCG